METLTALFGNQTKVKLLRQFLFNPATPFLPKELAHRTACAPTVVRKELSGLAKAGIIKRKQVLKSIETRQGDKISFKKLRGDGYMLDEKFPYLDPLKNLLTVASLPLDDSLAKRFTNAGRIKILVAAGIFLQQWDARVDLLIVGDELNMTKIESVIGSIEAEIGKEIAYSAFETADFEYRLGIHDRLVRDILDYPHMMLVDKLGVEIVQ